MITPRFNPGDQVIFEHGVWTFRHYAENGRAAYLERGDGDYCYAAAKDIRPGYKPGERQCRPVQEPGPKFCVGDQVSVYRGKLCRPKRGTVTSSQRDDAGEQGYDVKFESGEVRYVKEKDLSFLSAQEPDDECPPHYDLPIQPKVYCQQNDLPGWKWDVIKYTTRAGNKGAEQDDILKAMRCLELRLEHIIGEGR